MERHQYSRIGFRSVAAVRLCRNRNAAAGRRLYVCDSRKTKGGRIMSWDYFPYFALSSVAFWAVGSIAAWRGKRPWLTYSSTIVGLAIFFTFILTLWFSLERPPVRTMGETRLWYSFFLPLAGIITYRRWKYKWILSFSTI